MKKRISFLLFYLLATSSLFAHPPEFESDGTNTFLGRASPNRTVFGENYGGYGYLASSEAEAHNRLQIPCDGESQRQYLSDYCHGASIDPRRPTENLVNDTMLSIVLYRLRTHASEYLALNIRSAAQLMRQNLTLERPECVDQNSPSWRGVMREHYNARTKIGAKYEAVRATLRGENMAKALLYGERLEYGSESNNCQFSTGGRDPACTSIQHNSFRLRTSFPALFSTAVQGTLNNPMPLVRRTDHYDDFRNSLISLIGAHNAGDLSEIEVKTRGAAYLKNGIEQGPYSELENRLEQALTSAETEPTTTPLGKAYIEYKRAIHNLRKDHLQRMKQELANLCKNKFAMVGVWGGTRDRFNIHNMAIQHPNVIRQTMLDMSPSERGLTAAVLCNVGAIPPLQRDPQCDGVSGGPLPDNDVTVGRWKINDWPNGSQNYFTLAKAKTPPQAPITVKLNINFALGTSLKGLSSEILEQKLKAWQDDVNAWANCSVGAVPKALLASSNNGGHKIERSCPLSLDMARINPKIAFQINMRPTAEDPPPPPSVTLHQCYRLEIPGRTTDRGDCGRVRQFHINQCITEHSEIFDQCLASISNEKQCRLNVRDFCTTEIERKFAEEPDAFNRADSSNYSLNESFSVIRHEVFHQMGLADEYNNTERPYGLLGEHNSIMRNSRALDSRLFPRHAAQILDVLRCPAVAGEVPE